jgi:hypothetical protein
LDGGLGLAFKPLTADAMAYPRSDTACLQTSTHIGGQPLLPHSPDGLDHLTPLAHFHNTGIWICLPRVKRYWIYKYAFSLKKSYETKTGCRAFY